MGSTEIFRKVSESKDVDSRESGVHVTRVVEMRLALVTTFSTSTRMPLNSCLTVSFLCRPKLDERLKKTRFCILMRIQYRGLVVLNAAHAWVMFSVRTVPILRKCEQI